MKNQALLPEGWPRPKGYANGVAATGRQVYVAGQIGWSPEGVFPSDDLAAQARVALENVVAVLHAGGARPEHIVRRHLPVKSGNETREAVFANGRVNVLIVHHQSVGR